MQEVKKCYRSSEAEVRARVSRHLYSVHFVLLRCCGKGADRGNGSGAAELGSILKTMPRRFRSCETFAAVDRVQPMCL